MGLAGELIVALLWPEFPEGISERTVTAIYAGATLIADGLHDLRLIRKALTAKPDG